MSIISLKKLKYYFLLRIFIICIPLLVMSSCKKNDLNNEVSAENIEENYLASPLNCIADSLTAYIKINEYYSAKYEILIDNLGQVTYTRTIVNADPDHRIRYYDLRSAQSCLNDEYDLVIVDGNGNEFKGGPVREEHWGECSCVDQGGGSGCSVQSYPTYPYGKMVQCDAYYCNVCNMTFKIIYYRPNSIVNDTIDFNNGGILFNELAI